MRGTTPRQRGRELKKALAGLYDDGKWAEESNVIDCLTDLRHLCLTYDIDFIRADRIARDHAACEQSSNARQARRGRREYE